MLALGCVSSRNIQWTPTRDETTCTASRTPGLLSNLDVIRSRSTFGTGICVEQSHHRTDAKENLVAGTCGLGWVVLRCDSLCQLEQFMVILYQHKWLGVSLVLGLFFT